jgi:membrane-associated protease RseP (regulator of RpoE activity)
MLRLIAAITAGFLIASPNSAAKAALPIIEGDLPRQAELGFGTTIVEGAIVVSQLTQDSAAARAGLAEKDIIVSINHTTFDRSYVGLDLLEKLDGDRAATFAVRRNGRRPNIAFTPPKRPFEQINGVDSIYGVLTTSDGARLRTIITRPSGATGRLPAIFLVQWAGCDTVQFYGDAPWIVML